jgi:hypothetical protein
MLEPGGFARIDDAALQRMGRQHERLVAERRARAAPRLFACTATGTSACPSGERINTTTNAMTFVRPPPPEDARIVGRRFENARTASKLLAAGLNRLEFAQPIGSALARFPLWQTIQTNRGKSGCSRRRPPETKTIAARNPFRNELGMAGRQGHDRLGTVLLSSCETTEAAQLPTALEEKEWSRRLFRRRRLRTL